jgi:hypothetical protein
MVCGANAIVKDQSRKNRRILKELGGDATCEWNSLCRKDLRRTSGMDL